MDRQRQQIKANQPQTNAANLLVQSANPTNRPGPMSQTNETKSTKNISWEEMQ